MRCCSSKSCCLLTTTLADQGQGGGIAIEDAGSLAALLPLGTTKEDIPSRLKLYEELRDTRAHKVQQLTRLAGADLNHTTRGDFNSESFIFLLGQYEVERVGLS